MCLPSPFKLFKLWFASEVSDPTATGLFVSATGFTPAETFSSEALSCSSFPSSRGLGGWHSSL